MIGDINLELIEFIAHLNILLEINIQQKKNGFRRICAILGSTPDKTK